MICRSTFGFTGLAAGIALVGIALAQGGKEGDKPAPAKAPAPAQQSPSGPSEADMKACIEAATPGPMHQHLAQSVGTWSGKTTMWMAPGAEPQSGTCTSTCSAAMDGRFTTVEVAGDVPGMGPFSGLGIYGYDNVSKKFQSCWIDNMGTQIMNGTGTLSPDGNTLTWSLNYNCPVTKKPLVMREVERRTGKDAMTLEMFGVEPHSGKEFKMMEIAYTRKPGGASAVPASAPKK